ncbi:PRA1 family protein [Fragilaria crotonensis]|nr:PRA1 family protein [Fragilaria crotonensis]
MATTQIEAGTDDVEEHPESADVKKLKKKKKKNRRASSTVTSETLRLYVASVFLRLSDRITLDTLRPLPLFLGIQESGHSFCLSAGAFTTIPPADDQKSVWDQLHTRLALNVALFLTNYALVAGGVAIVIALLHPGMLLVLAAVSALWWCHDYLIHQTVTVGSHNIGTLLSINQRSMALTILTVVAIVWKCLIPVVSFLVVSGILIGLHAISRDPQHIEQYSQQLANGNNGTSTLTHGGQAIVDRGDII